MSSSAYPTITNMYASARHLLYASWLFLSFIPMMPLVILSHLLTVGMEERHRLRWLYRVNRLWMAFFQFMGRWRWRTHGLHVIQSDQTYVFVCNHVTLMDIPIVGGSVIHPWRSLAKREILRIPALGWIISNISIMVDRHSRGSRNQSLQQMKHALERGVSVLIFPEGTRNRGKRPLLPFYPGAFHVAISAQVPILPMLITHSHHLCTEKPLRFWPGVAQFTALTPIPTEGLTEADVPILMQRVHTYMQEELIRRDPHWAASTVSADVIR